MRRRHSSRPALPLLLLAAAACSAGAPQVERSDSAAQAPAAATGAPAAQQRQVLPGLEVLLRDSIHLVRGKRVGFITNQTAVTSTGESGIDVLHRAPGVQLVALYAVEHGLRGAVEGGVKIDAARDEKTGVQIHSLYGATQKPTPAMLQGVDVLVFDIQDIGARPYTFVWSMAMAMEAAGAQRIPFIVLDRPNPIGGEIVEGALLDPRFRSFVGMYPIPARHGMTVGELATLFNQRFGIGADLTVIRTAGWRRSMWLDDTGLPWVNPSPNLRSLAALQSYPGSVYFEGTNLTEGRGTERPFEQIGAPWLKAPEVASAMNAMGLPGVRFEAITMTVEPTAAKFPGRTIPAIRFAVTDRQAYRPVRTMLLLIDEIRRRHPGDFAWTGTIDRLTGSDRVRLAVEGGTLASLLADWDREAAEFRESRRPFLLYP